MLLLFAPAAAIVAPPFPEEGTPVTILHTEELDAITRLGGDDVTVL